MPRKTTEHSGNSPRSAYSDSSSSPIGKNMATSASPAVLSAKMGLSRTVDDVVSMSLNHLNSSFVEIINEDSSLPRFAKVSSGTGSGSGLTLRISGLVSGLTVEWWLLLWLLLLWWFLETGQGWLCSQEYVTTSMVGSSRLLSTCFLAGQPFELLHL
jgi:hypothetical protein